MQAPKGAHIHAATDMLTRFVCHLLSRMTLLITASVLCISAHAQLTLNLTTGWNLMGNSSAAPLDVTPTFGDPTKINSVWTWNKTASKWAFYAPSMSAADLATYAQGKGYDLLISIPSKEGFWVNASTPGSLPLATSSIAKLAESDLQVGWNLVSSADYRTPAWINLMLNTDMGVGGKHIVSIWTWNARTGKWKFYAPSLDPAGTLPEFVGQNAYELFSAEIGATEGVWVNVEAGSAAVIPLPTLKSSYENKVAAGKALGSQEIPLDWKPCGDRSPCGQYPAQAVAFADFLGHGTYGLITHSIETNAVNPLDQGRRGGIKYYEKVSGKWADRTSLILDAAHTTGCLFAKKAVVADFLKNGRPSVFFSCYGCDGEGVNCTVSGSGENQRILLAHSDGTFENLEIPMPIPCACHAASAADINGDGYPDILLIDLYTNKAAFFLINNGDGSFTPDYARIPANYTHKAIVSAELIDVSSTGKYDAVLAGVEECCTGLTLGVTIVPNDGTGQYSSEKAVTLPSISGFGSALDILYEDGYFYVNRTIDHFNLGDYYGGFLLQKVNYKTLESRVLYQTFTSFATGNKWIDWVIPYGPNIVGLGSIYNFSTPK